MDSCGVLSNFCIMILRAVSKPLLSDILTFLEFVPFVRRVKKISPIVGTSLSIEIFSLSENGTQKCQTQAKNGVLKPILIKEQSEAKTIHFQYSIFNSQYKI